jgi:hypothetical protein
MDTVIEKNVNPIQEVERSVLIQAQTVLSVPAHQLVKNQNYQF